MICARCEHPILPGQLWRPWPIWKREGQPAHVACPTARQIWAAYRWGRW